MPSSAPATRRVLVIDDDAEFGRIVGRFLQRDGCEALHAAGGEVALTHIQSCAPDLILLDIHLPGIDGIQLFKRFREHPRTRHVQIILMTGESILDSILEEAVANLRAEPVYHKGGSLEPLVSRVRQALAAPAAEEPRENPCDEGILRRGPLVVDLIHREVRLRDGPTMRLTARPFEMLVAFLRREGPLTQHELQRQIWPESADLKKVGVTVLRLRRDLEPMARLRIETVGDAYRLVIDST